MPEIRLYIRNIFKSKGHMKYWSMYPKETPTIYSAKKVWPKYKKDQNLKEVISEPKWAFLYQCFTREAKLSIVSEEDKFVSIVKEVGMFLELCTPVRYVEDRGRWCEKSKLKTRSKKWKWNVSNAKEAGMQVNRNVLFVGVKK